MYSIDWCQYDQETDGVPEAKRGRGREALPGPFTPSQSRGATDPPHRVWFYFWATLQATLGTTTFEEKVSKLFICKLCFVPLDAGVYCLLSEYGS